MTIDPWFVAAILLVVGILRLAFGVAHGAAYMLFARSFRRFGKLPVARAGAGLAKVSVLLPLAGVVFAVVSGVAMFVDMPPGGIRRSVEIPVITAVLAAIELAPGAVLLGILTVLHVMAQRRAR
jgi:hypothetical protein